MSGLLEAAREVKEKGSFSFLDHIMTTPELNGFMILNKAAAAPV